MTVKELIEELSKIEDKEKPVLVPSGCYYDIVDVIREDEYNVTIE
jgi:hypothetical protein